ncbi:MAG: DNA polymerase III subunit beta [Eubacterium sp.]|nr:DNA polymerase III subunit beta [Eubacterium sp.]
MKLVFDKNKLLEAVNIVMKAVPVRTTMPILECILIDASGLDIRLTGNDTELGIETIVEGEIKESGRIAIDAKIFSNIVHKLPDADVTIQTDDNLQTLITCGKSRFNIPGKDPDDYSKLPAVDKDDSVTISQFSLREIIRQTIFSIAVNENNKIMTGELFEIRNNTLRVVSLDGHRIAMRMLPLSGPAEDKKVVVPGKTLSEVGKILTGGMEDPVDIFFSRNHMMFEFGKSRVVTNLIDGEYFAIDQMLSTDYDTKVVVNNSEFQSCIDRSSLLIRDADKVPVLIDIDDTEMHLHIDSPMGSMNESVDIDKAGKDIRIGFNPKFLLDALRVIDDENVTLYFMNAKAPCFIRDDEGTYIYLVLPVNINA